MYKSLLFCIAILGSISLPAYPIAIEENKKISESLGHLIGKNLESLDLPLDLSALIQGLQDEVAGKSSPMNEEECEEVIASFQLKKLALKREKNLREANLFLAENQKKEGIVSLEDNNLQYEILKAGTGQFVQSYNSPLIRCKGSFLTGESFQSGYEEELISLNETIPGLSKGILGMREGEIRTLYIHPSLGYESQEHLQTNSLLIFEIEVIKADASSEAHAASNRETLPFLFELNANFVN